MRFLFSQALVSADRGLITIRVGDIVTVLLSKGLLSVAGLVLGGRDDRSERERLRKN